MKTLAITIGAVLVAALAACDAPRISAPRSATVSPGGIQPKLTTNTVCYDEIDAGRAGAVPTQPGPIITNCQPETCGPGNTPQLVSLTEDASGLLDQFVVQCPNTDTDTVMSNQECWHCVEGCGGSACPAGAKCMPIPGQQGSDCLVFTCPEGWDFYDTGALTPPKCRRPAPCLSVTMEGPSKIQPGAQCTWTALPTGGSGPYIYHWFREVEWVSGGATYTGGRPNGTLLPQFTLRLEVSSGTQQATTSLLVKESSTAMVCPS